MSNTISSVQLSIPKELDKAIYDFFSVKLINSTEGRFEDHYSATIQKEFITEDENGLMFSVTISDKKTNKEENDLEELEKVLSFLHEKIILYTNTNGAIKSIINRSIIREGWEDMSSDFRKKNRKQIPNIENVITGINETIDDSTAFLNLIKKSEIYSLLFPPVFDINLLEKKIVPQKKELHNFFEHTELPLDLDTKIVGFNVLTNGLQITRNGKLDNFLFDEDAVAAFFLDSYGVHRSNLSFDATLLESYDLDSKNRIDKANGFLNVVVPNVFRYRQINKLIQKK